MKRLSLLVVTVLASMSAVPGSADTHQVAVGPGLTFAPASLNIQVGDTVTWTNVGGFHNVAANDSSFRCAEGCDGEGGDGNPSSSAWSFSRTFDSPGVIGYVCELHSPTMAGEVIVGGGGGAAGSVRFASSAAAVAESAGQATLTVQRTGGDDGAISVQVMTTAGSASAGSDFTATLDTLSWTDNDDDPKTISVPILEDTADEGDETFTLTLFSPTGGATLGSPSIAAVTITDNDDPPPPACVADATTLCLNDGRFQARLHWRFPSGLEGEGQAIGLASDDSGLFYFLNPNNAEMLLKVLTGCPVNERYWVFFAATTNVEFLLTVTDTQTDTVKTYFNPLGTPAPPVQDTGAFATCP